MKSQHPGFSEWIRGDLQGLEITAPDKKRFLGGHFEDMVPDPALQTFNQGPENVEHLCHRAPLPLLQGFGSKIHIADWRQIDENGS